MKEPWEYAEDHYGRLYDEAKKLEREHWDDEGICELCGDYNYVRDLRKFNDHTICIDCIRSIKLDGFEEAFEYYVD